MEKMNLIKKKIRNPINDIENFWDAAKMRLSKFRGMNKRYFLLVKAGFAGLTLILFRGMKKDTFYLHLM